MTISRRLVWGVLAGILLMVALYGGRSWWRKRSYTTTLAIPRAVLATPDAERYAALLGSPLRTAAGRTVEVMGNPAATRYSDCRFSFARNPWDMQAHEGRLYIGLGDAQNDSPSRNAGPVPVLTWNPAERRLQQEAILDEEQIDRFYRFNDTLLIPGDDPREGWEWGNLYSRQAGGIWLKQRTLPRTVHTHALAWHQGRLFAGLGITDAVPGQKGKDGAYGSAVAESADQGATWRIHRLGGWRILDFLQVEGRLFATEIYPGQYLREWLSQRHREPLYAGLYEYGNDGSFHRRPDLTDQRMLPDTPQTGQGRRTRIQLAQAWGQTAVYLGVVAGTKEEWPSRGIYVASRLTPDQVTVSRLVLPPKALAWDLAVEGEELWVLFAEPLPEGRWRNRLWSTRNGRDWREVVSLDLPALVRSFARLDGAIYLGLGVGAMPTPPTCTLTDQLSGTLLRIAE